MLQTKDNLLHGQTPFADDTRRVEQDEARYQAQHEMPRVRVFTLYLTGLSGQQMFQGPKHKRDPVPPPPPTDQLWCAPLRLQTQQREAIMVRFVHNHHGHLARGGTGGPQTYVVYPWLPGVLPPGPRLTLDQVPPFPLAPISQGQHIGLLALSQQGALVRVANMLHALRVAKSTIGDYHRRGQQQAASLKSR